MKKLSARISKLSYLAAYFFSAVLFVSANSASSLLSIKKHLPSPFGYSVKYVDENRSKSNNSMAGKHESYSSPDVSSV